MLRLILDGKAIKFEPDFCDFETVLVNIYDVMLKAINNIPRIESRIYTDWVGSDLPILFAYPYLSYLPILTYL